MSTNTKRLGKLIGKGAQADVYAVDNKAIKVFKEHCSKIEVFYEALVNSVVESIDLPVPKIYEVIQIENRMGIVMDLIEGISMEQVILNDLNNLEFYLDQIIDLQIKIHSINIQVPGLLNMKDRLEQRISQSPILNNSQKKSLHGLLNGFDFGASLCHGDFHLMNLIKTDQNIVAIDWVDATYGSPEADLCRTYLLAELYSPEGFADIYLDLYCQKTNKQRKDILKWLPVIAGARLTERNESEEERLLQWVEMDLDNFLMREAKNLQGIYE